MKNILLFVLVLTLNACSGQKNSTSEVHGDVVTQIHDSTLVIFQDANSNYWIGSNGHGVYKYDGKKLVQFTVKHGLFSNHVNGIKEDMFGNIFFETRGGICKYDGQTISTLVPTAPNSFNSGWALNKADLWFKGPKGPYCYDGKNLFELVLPKNDTEEKLRKQFPNMSYSPYEVYSLYKDKKGNMWFGTGNLGVCRYDGTNFSWLYEDQLQYASNGGSFGMRAIIEDKDGSFWFNNTTYRYKIETKDSVGQTQHYLRYKKEKGIEIPAHFKIDPVFFMSAVEDNSGDLWMATYADGAWCYKNKTVSHFNSKVRDKNVTFFSIYKDNQDGIWLATHTDGVYRFNGKHFEKFKF